MHQVFQVPGEVLNNGGYVIRYTYHQCGFINNSPQILSSIVFILGQTENDTLFVSPVSRQSSIYRPAVIDLVEVVQVNSVQRSGRVRPSHLCVYIQIDGFYFRRVLVFTPDQPVVSSINEPSVRVLETFKE